MYYIGNVVKSVAGFYNQINSATLTGAIDIIVVKQEDGSFVGSPFHVRFGKLGVLSSREKVVEIAVNDVEASIQMKLGRAGEAFFVERASTLEDVPQYLTTSPIPSTMNMLKDVFECEKENQNLEEVDAMSKITITDTEGSFIEDHTLPGKSYSSPVVSVNSVSQSLLSKSISNSIPIPGSTRWNTDKDLLLHQNQLNPRLHELKAYPLSDMDSPISTPLSSSPLEQENERVREIYSDTELETSASKSPENSTQHDITWEWGMLPEGAPKQRSVRDSKTGERKRKSDKTQKLKKATGKNKTKPSKPGEGLLLSDVLAADKEVADLYLNRTNSMEDFDSGFDRESTPIRTDENNDDQNKDDTLPILLDEEEPNDIALSLCGDLKNRRIEPEKFFDALVTFDQFSENPALLNDRKLVIRINKSYYNWSVAAPYLMSYMAYQRPLTPESLKNLQQQFMPKKRKGWFSSWRTATHEEQESSEEEGEVPKVRDNPLLEKLSDADDLDSDTALNIGSDINSESEIDGYKKTLRLTSEQWKLLNLKPGTNKVTFTVTTKYQGTASCESRIFLWDHKDKIVISDIDGTITRSDVLGQILPVVGKDWSQIGVAGLFDQIKRNSYHFMYLSARSIGQAQLTRDFLRSVKQGELTLPEGPVLLTPTSLLIAFRKEVIEKKPEEFKISCMRDIQSLFPTSPFYSGFGNKINDVWAYRAVGIPISRIFTINYKGEIKHELTNTFSTSYNKLMELVDQMYPPLTSSKTVDSAQSNFTSFSYWRTPIPELPLLVDSENVEEFEFP